MALSQNGLPPSPARSGVEGKRERRGQKRGGAWGGAPRYKRRTVRTFKSSCRRERVLPSCPCLRLGWLSSSSLAWLLCCWSVEEVLRSRPVKGGTDGRRGSAGCVVDLRVRTRSAGEGSPAEREVGARRDHADGRGRGTHQSQKGSPFSSTYFFGFLYACCGAVSNKIELPK